MTRTLTAVWKNRMGIIQEISRHRAAYLEKGFWKSEEERGDRRMEGLGIPAEFCRGPRPAV